MITCPALLCPSWEAVVLLSSMSALCTLLQGPLLAIWVNALTVLASQGLNLSHLVWWLDAVLQCLYPDLVHLTTRRVLS